MEKFNIDAEKQLHPNYEAEILSDIRSASSPARIREEMENYHANDIADACRDMSLAERQRLYRILPMETLAEMFSYLEREPQLQFLKEIDLKHQAEIISNFDDDEAVDLLKAMSREERETLINLMDPEQKNAIAKLSVYDEDQIGSRITTEMIVVDRSSTVPEAMKALIAQAADVSNINTIYVTENNGSYYGAVPLRDLIIARKEERVEDLVITSYPYVYASEAIDQCLEWIKDYSEDSIPALGDDNTILGIITSQDLVEIVDEELGEDYAKLAGLAAEEDLEEPVRVSIKKRLPWLIVLLFLGMMVSSVVGIFEKIVAEVTVLMLFQSLILDMSGNVGTQSLAVTIRVLMDDSIEVRQKAKLIWKEGRVALSNGLILGAAAFVFAGVYMHLMKHEPWAYSFMVSGCIGIALIVAMFISGVVGTVIPMFFKKIHVDPAVASGPLITTINDMVAVITYYSLAWLLLIRGFGM